MTPSSASGKLPSWMAWFALSVSIVALSSIRMASLLVVDRAQRNATEVGAGETSLWSNALLTTRTCVRVGKGGGYRWLKQVLERGDPPLVKASAAQLPAIDLPRALESRGATLPGLLEATVAMLHSPTSPSAGRRSCEGSPSPSVGVARKHPRR